MSWPNIVTVSLIVGTVLSWIAWDIPAFTLETGGAATESVTLGTWFYKYAWIAVVMGLFVGHIIRSGPSTPSWSHIVLFVGAAIIGYIASSLT